MELPYQPPSILRLYGITLNDYVPVEDVADERLLTSAVVGARGLDPEEPPPEALCPLDKVPRTFTGLDDWPQGTNLRCWQCDYTFDGRPKFVPTYVRETDTGGLEFGVQGNMCTFNCAELWIRINYAGKDDLRWRAQDLLCLVYFLFTGRRVARIPPAPLKTEQQRYGGDLDEGAFWKKLRSLDPVDGLRDHMPGSIRPERDRASDAKSFLRGLEHGRRELPCAPKSIWEVCGLPLSPADRAGPESKAPDAESEEPCADAESEEPCADAESKEPDAVGPAADAEEPCADAEGRGVEPPTTGVEPPTKVVHLKRRGGVELVSCDVYIGRPMYQGGWHLPGSKWANPFSLAKFGHDRRRVLDAYEAHVRADPELMAALPELRGKRLGCWCKPLACHGDILVRLLAELDEQLDYVAPLTENELDEQLDYVAPLTENELASLLLGAF